MKYPILAFPPCGSRLSLYRPLDDRKAEALALPRRFRYTHPVKPSAPPWLPALNTTLILISGVAILVGYTFIRTRRTTLHHRSMLVGTAFAGLFLVVYMARASLFQTKIFAGHGVIRFIYLLILTSHTLLAIAVGPLALITLVRAFRGDFARHKRIARVTLPIWLYVAASGWIIYWMLYSL
ncbi:MAG: DUF420 domain-containing protein [Armatimonadota bacterium]|nr:DUF420 domain-containing protein [Armatimonadota bacterium]MDR5702414.1 DUF420 domain-containing protein [Armatimonadota bacterium]MDR7435608.1 DUF420 domain-containing protein [Armatimonadota bacterium]